jgi:multiple sugar transport system substrate-binding protein
MFPSTSRRPLAAPRRLLRGLATAALILPIALGAAACGGGDDNSGGGGTTTENVELSVFWWGADKRAELTQKVLDLYHSKHPNVTFKTTWQGNSGYFDKLATQAAAGNAPDIFQIDDNALTEYADRNITLDLTKYVDSKKIDITKFPESLAKYGVVNGKQAGIALAENTPGMIYDKTLLASVGAAEPQIGWSWDQLITWAADVTAKTKGKVYGTMDPSADYKALWMWLRQQGKELYNGKQLGFTADDLSRWFTLWKGARDTKAAPPADVIQAANAGDVTKQLVATGKAATSFLWANQMPELAKNTKNQLGVVSYPGDPSAQWARASMYWSIYRGSKHADVAADFVNFFVNDPEAGQILGTERGLSSNTDIRQSVANSATDTNTKASIAFEAAITPKFGAAPVPPPKGHSKVRAALVVAAESVQFAKASPQQAAASFVTEANSALSG